MKGYGFSVACIFIRLTCDKRANEVVWLMRFLRLIGGAALTLWLTLTVVFFMVRWAPGGPFEGEKAMSAQQKAQLEKAYGLDRPMHEQYAKFFANLMRGDFGVSMALEGQSVREIIGRAFPVSLKVGVGALLLAVVIGVPLGFYWALKNHKGRWIYFLAMLPSFVLAPIVQQIVLSCGGVAYGYEGWRSIFWPAIVLGIYYLPFVARLSQTGFVDEAKSLYLRTAQAKGRTRRRALWLHGYRAALSPVLAYLGPTAAALITGAFVVETVWGLPGMGRFFVNAVFNRDDTLLMGLVAFYTVILVVFNLAVEIILQAWNPTARRKKKKKKFRGYIFRWEDCLCSPLFPHCGGSRRVICR